MAANRIIAASLASLLISGCAYGTIKNVPEEMVVQPEADRDLVASILAGDGERVDHLIATGANIDQVGTGGVTPLIAAAIVGTNDVAARLLELGADSSAKDEGGKNALAYALETDNEALVTLLVEHARTNY